MSLTQRVAATARGTAPPRLPPESVRNLAGSAAGRARADAGTAQPRATAQPRGTPRPPGGPGVPRGATPGERLGGLNVPPPQPRVGFAQRVAGSPTGAKVAGAASRIARPVAKVAAPLAVGLEGYDVYRTATDPNATGADVATQVAEGTGRLGAAAAGALAGGAVGNVPGAVIGGIAGGVLGDTAIRAGREFLGQNPDSPVEQLANRREFEAIQGGLAANQTPEEAGRVIRTPGAGQQPAVTQVLRPAAGDPPAVAAQSGPAFTPRTSGNLIQDAPNSFTQKPGGGTVTLADVQGLGDIGQPGGGLTVAPGLFSGVSGETERALAEGRQAAADRGDFEAVDRSYLANDAERAQYQQGKTERRILKRLGGLPAAQQPDALRALRDGQQGPGLDQVRAARALELQAGAPPAEADQLLFGQRPGLAPKLIPEPVYGEDGLRTGTRYLDPATNRYIEPEGGQAGQEQGAAQPTAAHIKVLTENSGDPQAIQAFEAVYGPGSAQQYLTRA